MLLRKGKHMLKEIEGLLIERYKTYFTMYLEFNKDPSSCEAGHLQEISWILHVMFGYTDRQLISIEEQVRKEVHLHG